MLSPYLSCVAAYNVSVVADSQGDAAAVVLAVAGAAAVSGLEALLARAADVLAAAELSLSWTVRSAQPPVKAMATAHNAALANLVIPISSSGLPDV